MKMYRIPVGILLFFALLFASPWNDVLGQRSRDHRVNRFMSNLTEEQRVDVREKIDEMKSQGATRKEIHTAVAEMLEVYGVELPEKWGKGHRGGHMRFLSELTDEQREAVRDKIEEMRSQGVTREEIHTAVAEMLKGYGVELPERWGEGPPGGHMRFLSNLTEEQREAVRNKIEAMINQDATREEIHTAVAEMFEGFGIELPDDWGERHRGGHRRFLSELTDEQREAVREKIREMRNQGATREEIRATIDELLEGFGIELPDEPENTSSEKVSTQPGLEAQNYPNPFNPQTQIAYSLPEDSYVKFTVYNIQGKKVKVLVDEYQTQGAKTVIWDGCDESGEKVASGVYFYRIEAGPHSVANQMILLK
ncbi:MAG: hypothetical protein AMJ90_04660 [candidate division Zixibacteria bacterium SM23_73_2]|nr:MAG: hypothetical protein AMJ90_04660 [candidate division Zixibacteria bacterium SM23_73_2]